METPLQPEILKVQKAGASNQLALMEVGRKTQDEAEHMRREAELVV